MPRDAKLQALQRACEVEEQRALEEKMRVDSIVEARQSLVDQIGAEREELERTLEGLHTKRRDVALQNGDASQLASISRYRVRLTKELGEIEENFQARLKELDVALARAEIAEEELVAARVERKKVEKFLDSREQSARVVDAAIEESESDELSYYRRGKK